VLVVVVWFVACLVATAQQSIMPASHARIIFNYFSPICKTQGNIREIFSEQATFPKAKVFHLS
jgi:hypothetical protein